MGSLHHLAVVNMTLKENLNIILDGTPRRRLVMVLIGTLIAGLLEILGIGTTPAFVGVLIDPDWVLSVLPGRLGTNWMHQTTRSDLLLWGATLLCGIFLFKNLYVVVLMYRETYFAQHLAASISNRLFCAYMKSPYQFHLQRNPAEFIRLVTEEAFYAMHFVRAGLRLIREGVVLALVLLLMVVVEPLATGAVFLLLALLSGIFYSAARRVLTSHGQRWVRHWTRRLQVVTQSFGAIKDAKILGREPHFMAVFRSVTDRLQHHETFHEIAGAVPRYFLETLAVASVVPIAVTFILLDKPLNGLLPLLALWGVALVRILPAMTTINSSLVEIRYRRPALDGVCAELKAVEIPVVLPVQNQVLRPKGRPMRETLTVENVHYVYPGATGEALKGVSLTIQPATTVGFVGASGAGKSTLIDIILGLLNPTVGRVLVDGVDIHNDLLAWQRQVGYVPQNFYLIDDSIRRNIAFGIPDDKIDDLAVARAVQAVQIESFVNSLPEGLETAVGHEGLRLSGGQRQRIAIARALYHDPSVLVMDEATNALDDETESDLMEAVRALPKEKTIIIVAHRPSTVDGCDQLIRLQAGRIVREFRMAIAR